MRHEHGGNIYNKKCDIDFSSNINPLGMSENIKKAFINSFDMSVFYPNPECTELRKKISLKENVDFNNIICSNGAAELIFTICFALKPKKALLAAPCFVEYEQALNACGCDIERYILKEENNFCFDDGFLNKITDDTDIVFFTNPNNPTGILADAEYVEKLSERCLKTNTIVVFDECFLDFVLNGENCTAKRFLSNKNIIILKAFTKFYAMPGLRLGYGLFAENDIALKVRSAMQTWSVSTPAQMAGIAALDDEKEYEGTVDYIEKEKEYVLSYISNLAYKIYGHSANFIFFKEREDFDKLMLEKGILIRSCKNYYSLDGSFFRIAVKSRDCNEKLIQAWTEIKRG